MAPRNPFKYHRFPKDVILLAACCYKPMTVITDKAA